MDISIVEGVKRTKPKYQPGETVWFLKSVRMCKFIEENKDGTVTVEVLDSGKRLTATYDGLSRLIPGEVN